MEFNCYLCRKDIANANFHELNTIGARICTDCLAKEGVLEVSDKHEKLRLRRVAFEEECSAKEEAMLVEEHEIEDTIHKLQKKHFPASYQITNLNEILGSGADRFYIGENLLSLEHLLYSTLKSLVNAISEGRLWTAKSR